MTQEKKRGRGLPIGYWLRRADELLTQRIDEAQLAHDLTRLDWQILNLIRDAGATGRDDVVAVLSSFADAATLDEALAHMGRREWIESGEDGELELTETGVELLGQALSLQVEIRRRAAAGISEADYETTLRVLQRLVANLEQDTSH